jgi:hypothetical protein
VKSNVCARAKEAGYCNPNKYFPPAGTATSATVLPNTNWFRKLKWSDDSDDGSGASKGTGTSRICLVTAGKINGINTAECP